MQESDRTGLRFTEVSLQWRGGQRRGLLVTPTREIVLDRSRLERARTGDHSSGVDDAIVRSVEVWLEPVDVLLFRARSSKGNAGWHFAADLDASEVEELGYRMMRSHISLYRRLVRRRVFAMVGTDLGQREQKALETGGRRLIAELERALPDADEPDRSVHNFDRWLLRNLALWTTQSLDEYLHSGLRRTLGVIDSRREELAVLRSALPLSELD